MTISTKTKLADLVNEKPALVEVFNKHKIDYCCGGQRSLELACKEMNLSVDAVLKELEQMPSCEEAKSADWMELNLSQLTAHIVSTHHAYLRKEFPRITALMNRVVERHGEKHEELVSLKNIFEQLKENIDQHSFKEEQVLFPMVCEMEKTQTKPEFHCGEITNPLNQMETEHDNAGGALKKMRELTNDYTPPEDACPKYKMLFDGLRALEADLHLHVHKENNILHPRIRDLNEKLS